MYPGPLDRLYVWAYLPDMARAMAVLAEKRALTGRAPDIAALSASLRPRGIAVLVDVSHALGVIPVDGRLADFMVCAPHDVAEEQLAILFNEKVVGLGLGKNQNTIVEPFVSSHGGWTILVTMTNGMSCFAASGENWTASDGLAGLAS
ncbi:MAG: hypothetical protein VCD31_06170 [Alphaproteobacteria bacterium]